MKSLADASIVNDGSVDVTAGIQGLADQANSTGETLFIPAGIYRIDGTVTFKNIIVQAEYGAVFQHNPANDNTDCVIITGSNTGRSKLQNLTIRRAAGAQFGRDLLKINKGDYVVVEDVYIENSKRDGVHTVPYGSDQWIENLILNRVKVQGAGRDSFGYTLVAGTTNVFINQVDMIQCESRSPVRYALRMENLSTGSNSIKMSNFRFMNCEFHASGAVSDPIISLTSQAPSGNSACLENLSFHNCAVEDTSGLRTGPAIAISGRMQGKFEFKNSIMFGTASDITGDSAFPFVEIEDIASPFIPVKRSYAGVSARYTTSNLAPNAYEDTIRIAVNEIMEGWVFNASGCFNRFTVMNGTYLYVHDAVKVDVSLVDGVIRLTNYDSSSRVFVLHLQRITKN